MDSWGPTPSWQLDVDPDRPFRSTPVDTLAVIDGICMTIGHGDSPPFNAAALRPPISQVDSLGQQVKEELRRRRAQPAMALSNGRFLAVRCEADLPKAQGEG